jgi:transcriptional regulator with XRE-family HTH domain
MLKGYYEKAGAVGQEVSVAVESLGTRIREERNKRSLTLEQLSERTGLSKSFLSQVERDLAQPSISSLKKIAHQFGLSVVNFFGEAANQEGFVNRDPGLKDARGNGISYVEDVKVVRANRRKGLALPGSSVVYELLTPDLNRQLEVMYMRINAGETSGREPLIDPPGEKFGLVLKGSLEVKVKEDVYLLRTGDSIYFPAHFPHSWCGLETDPIEAIWVLTPPWF